MIPYDGKTLLLNKNFSNFYLRFIFHKKNLNDADIETGRLAQTAAVLLEAGSELVDNECKQQ